MYILTCLQVREHNQHTLELQGAFENAKQALIIWNNIQSKIMCCILSCLQVREHNQQILELQGALEKAKQEEENRGGGAADAKRWTGVRNAPEARELLRTVFRIACDHK